MIKDISKKELLSILEIIDRWARISYSDDFEDIFKSLSSLLPYEISLCAIGNTKSLTLNKLINNKFPSDLLQPYLTKKMLQNDILVQKTLTLNKKAHFMNIEEYNSKTENKKHIELIKDAELIHCLSSAFSESNGKTTFLYLSKLMEKPHPCYLQIIDFLMPHLHHTINRIYRTGNENVNLHDLSNLTVREIEVLKWVKEGKTNWEISQIMNISYATVKFHLANILKKLDAVNRGHAVAKALEKIGGL